MTFRPSARASDYETVGVPACEIIHFLDPADAGQLRGVSRFVPGIANLLLLHQYDVGAGRFGEHLRALPVRTLLQVAAALGIPYAYLSNVMVAELLELAAGAA